MCYYALLIFSGCGHAIQGQKPVNGAHRCPLARQRQELDNRSSGTPSLSNSVSTRPSPRTTISTLDAYQPNAETEAEASAPSHSPCGQKMTHPLFTHRVRSLCDECWQQSERRMAELEASVLGETHHQFVLKAKRDKVVFEGRRPRQLQLVAMRDAERAVERAVPPLTPPKPAPTQSVEESQTSTSPVSIKTTASTISYVRGLWEQTRTFSTSAVAQTKQSLDRSLAGGHAEHTPEIEDQDQRLIEVREIEPG